VDEPSGPLENLGDAEACDAEIAALIMDAISLM
jgi:hypothetical protein